MPLVSVVLTSYNHEKYLAASIESVLNQTFEDFELLICDDGSTDNSQEIIKNFKDSRIKIFLYNENRGSYFATQEPIKISTGKYFALQHSDDIWEVTKLEKQVQFLEENQDYEVCFTQAKFIDERGELYDLPENHPYKNVFKQENRSRAEWLNYLFWKSNCFCNPSMLMRNSPKNFAMNPCLFQFPDYFMWINLCLRKNVYVLQEELIKFRLRRGNQDSVSSWNIENNLRISNELYLIAKQFLPLLRDEKFFLQVFPEAEEFLIDGKISTEFAFAQLCLKRDLPAFQKLALEILYDLLHNEKKRNLIKKIYGYDEKNFIRDSGNFDIFGIKSTLQILNCKLYLDCGSGFNEKDIIKSAALVRADENFTATFTFRADKKIERLRFDPDEKAALSIKILKITVNGEIVEKFTSNAFQIVDGYFNFLTADPFFTIEKKISAENIQVEILGAVRYDSLSNFEKKYSETCATLQEKNLQVQQLEKSLQEKNSQVQQLEKSLQEKVSQVQQLEKSLQEKIFQVQQLETSLQEKEFTIHQQQVKINQQEKNLQSKFAEIKKLQKLQNEILSSNSWKVTKPLRIAGRILKKL